MVCSPRRVNGNVLPDLCQKWDVRSPYARERTKTGASLKTAPEWPAMKLFPKNLQQGEHLLLASPPRRSNGNHAAAAGARRRDTRFKRNSPKAKLGKGTLSGHCYIVRTRNWRICQSKRSALDRRRLQSKHRLRPKLCRHEILPIIERRWPDFRNNWERSRELIAESQELLNDLASLDLKRCAGNADNVLLVDDLRLLSTPRRQNALRHWIESAIGEPADWKKVQE